MGGFFPWLCNFIHYQIGGWTAKAEIPENVNKAIIIVAPHTANKDFPVGLGARYKMQIDARFLAKKELFEGPFGWIFKVTGGIPVDRSKKNNLVDQVADLFSAHESLFLVIAPEGTRKLTSRWKTGFYHMAKKANVPIIMAFIDFRTKEAGLGGILHPTGNMEEDFATIEKFYSSITAAVPENFNPKMNDETRESGISSPT